MRRAADPATRAPGEGAVVHSDSARDLAAAFPDNPYVPANASGDVTPFLAFQRLGGRWSR
jgi:hypothetical protein